VDAEKLPFDVNVLPGCVPASPASNIGDPMAAINGTSVPPGSRVVGGSDEVLDMDEISV
jgi:hypothetical protein